MGIGEESIEEIAIRPSRHRLSFAEGETPTVGVLDHAPGGRHRKARGGHRLTNDPLERKEGPPRGFLAQALHGFARPLEGERIDERNQRLESVFFGLLRPGTEVIEGEREGGDVRPLEHGGKERDAQRRIGERDGRTDEGARATFRRVGCTPKTLSAARTLAQG